MMEKKIIYDPVKNIIDASGGTKENPINNSDIINFLQRDPHYILNNLKKKKPEFYRHIVGLLICFNRDLEGDNIVVGPDDMRFKITPSTAGQIEK